MRGWDRLERMRRGIERTAVGLSVLASAAFVVALGWCKLSSNDIWILLETGEYILRHRAVPVLDPFSFTAADRPYVVHEWLAAVLFRLVDAAAGPSGLIPFKTAVVAAACAGFWCCARLLGASLGVLLPAFALGGYIAGSRFLERPHVFSFLFFAVYLACFLRYRERERNRAWLWAIPPLHVLWVNLHGGHVQGLLLLAVLALGETLAVVRARWLAVGAERAVATRDAVLLWCLVPATLLAALVNPYGIRLLKLPFELTSQSAFMEGVYEWLPPYDPGYNRLTMFGLFLVLLVLTSSAFFATQRSEARPKGWFGLVDRAFPFAPVGIGIVLGVAALRGAWKPGLLAAALWALFALICVFVCTHVRSVDFTLAGVQALVLLFAIRHNRGVADAAFVSFVLLAASASKLWRRIHRRPIPVRGKRSTAEVSTRSASRPAAVLAGSAVLLALAADVALGGYRLELNGVRREQGLGIATNVPVCALDFLRDRELSGNAFVAYTFGGPLIHWTYPAVRVGMDSRNEVYGERLFQEYAAALTTTEGMRAFLARYDVDFFFLPYSQRSTDVFDPLEASGEFVPVYYDERAFVLARRSAEHAALIEREAYRVIRPGGISGPTRLDSGNVGQALDEARRMIRNCQGSGLGWYYATRALLTMHRWDEALTAARELTSRLPDHADGWTFAGAAAEALGRTDEAIAFYRRAVALRPGHAHARAGLARLGVPGPG